MTTEKLYDLLPEDGSSVANSKLLAKLRETDPELTEANYCIASATLRAAGTVKRTRGRGGPLCRVLPAVVFVDLPVEIV